MDANRIVAVLTAVHVVTSMVASGAVVAQEGSEQPSIPASYYGDVTIDGEPAPEGTEIEAVVNGDVRDSITVNETGRYGGPGLNDEKLEIANVPNGSTVTFRIDGTPADRTEPATVEYEPGTTQQVDLAISPNVGLFEAEIRDATDEVVAGESIELDAAIENVAGNADTQTVNVTLNGAVVAQRELTIDSNETATFDEVVPTDGSDVGDGEIAVETADDRASQAVRIDAPARVNITDLTVEDVGSAGESFNATVTVENGGDVDTTENVTVAFGGETVADRAVDLAADESETVSVTVETDVSDAGERSLIAETSDDRAIETVDLSSPAFLAVDVIETDSDTAVTAGQNATVAAEIENTGGAAATQDVDIASLNTDLTIADLTVEAGESTFIEREIETVESDGGDTLEVTVETDDDSDGLDVAVENATDPTFEVDIDDITGDRNEPVTDGDETLDVDVTVENIGGENGTQEVQFLVDGEERADREVTLSGAAAESGSTSTQFTAEVPLERGDAPDVDVTVVSDDSEDTQNIELTPTPEFVIDSVEIPDRVNRTEEFTPTVTVENVGGRPASATVGIFFNGTPIDTVDVGNGAIGTGPDNSVQQGTIALNASERGIEGDTTTLIEANVTNGASGAVDDTSIEQIAISDRDPANFTVESATVTQDGDPVDEVVAGEDVTVNATINNTGEQIDNQTVILEFGGTTIAAEPVESLAGSDDPVSVSGEYTTGASDIDTGVEATASTDDDDGTDTVDVLEPAAFDVEIVAIDEAVIAGDSLDVDVRVENVGEEDGATGTVEVLSNGDGATRDVTLDGGASTIESFSFQPGTEDVGELDVVAVTEDAIDTDEATVGAPGEFEVSLAAVPSRLTDEETFNATVRVENVGDGEATETIALNSAAFEDSTSVTLDGGEVRRVELSDADVPDAATTDAVTVQAISADDETETTTVAIEEPPAPATFALSALEAPASLLEPESETNVTVNTTVRNVGDEEGTQTVELLVDGDAVDSAELELNGSESEDVSLSFDVDAGETGELDLTIESPDREVTGTLTVEEARPATLEIVEVSRVEAGGPGESLSLDATVENTGDRNVSDGSVTLRSPATGPVSADVTTAAGATETVSLSAPIDAAPRAGSFDRSVTVEAASDGDIDDERSLTASIDYGSVRSGLENAASGDTVLIAPETYDERDTISIATSDVTLENAGPGEAVIRSPDGATGVSIDADGVTLRGLTLEGNDSETAIVADGDATLQFLDVAGWDRGVLVESGEVTVESGTFERVDTGIEAAGGQSEIAYTTVRAETTGVEITSETTVRDSAVIGAKRGVDVVGAQNAAVERTTIRGNNIGVRVLDTGDEDVGIGLGDPEAVPIDGSNLESNGLAVLAVNATVNARGNWWGSQAGAGPADTAARSTAAAGDPLTSRSNSTFDVSIESVDLTEGSLERGVSSDVSVEVENTGTVGDTQEISLGVAGGPDPATQEINLDPGDTETVTFTLDVDQRFADPVTLTASSLDTDDARSPGVIEADSIDVSLDDRTITTAGSTGVTVYETFAGGDAPTVDVTGSVTIRSDERGVATVSGGTVTAQGTGDATITATFDAPTGDTLTDSAQLTVESEPPSPGGTDPGPDPGPSPDPDPGPSPDPEPAVDTAPAALGDVDPVATEAVGTQLDEATGRQTATFEGGGSVSSVAFDTDAEVGDVSVAEFDPAETGDVGAPGEEATIQEINVPEEASDTAATIEFAVPTDRIEETTDGVQAYRLNDDEWQPLETTVVDEDGDTLTVEAETPGFSLFAVSAVSAPEGAIALSPESATTGETVELSGADSTDEDGDIVAYEWRLDGETLDGETVLTTLEDPGEYTVELTVTDSAGQTDTVTETLVVEADDAGDDGEEPTEPGDGAPDDAGDDGEEPTEPGDGAPDDAGDDGAVSEPADLPGFGVGVAVIALLVAAFLARMIQD
jgi:PGF-pre-PGF domain-containing protein/PGF-CTERM protein